MSKCERENRRVVCVAVAMAVGGLAWAAVGAASGQVNGTYNGGVANWNVAGSWTGGIPATGGTATFTGGGTQTVTVPALFGTQLSRIVFDLDPGAAVSITSTTSGTTATQLNNNQGRITSTGTGGLTLTVTDLDAQPSMRVRITGTGGITKTGPGALTLGTLRIGTGGHNYSGPTAVNEGTLRLVGTVPGGGALTVATGATLITNYSGTSVRSAATTVDGTLTMLSGSGFNLSGTTTISAGSSVTVQQGASLRFQSTNTTISAGIVADGEISINTPTSSTFTLNRGAAGTYAIVSSAPGLGTATFGGDVLIGSLPVLQAQYRVGAALRVDEAGDINPDGVIEFTGGTFDVQRTGTLALNHKLISARVLIPAPPLEGEPPETLPLMEIRTAAGSEVTLTGDILFSGSIVANGDVTIAPSGGGLRTFSAGSFNPAAGAFIDVRDNSFVLFTSSEADTRSLVSAWLASTPGSEVGVGSSLAGTGGPTDRNFHATLGVRANTDASGLPLYTLFGGIGAPPESEFDKLLSTDVLVKFTYRGDTNLDGTLDASDFNAILNGWSNGLSGWANGDINYDGVVDATDFGLFLPAYQFVLGGGAPFGAGGSAGGVVPEPVAAGLLLPAAMLVGRRRR